MSEIEALRAKLEFKAKQKELIDADYQVGVMMRELADAYRGLDLTELAKDRQAYTSTPEYLKYLDASTELFWHHQDQPCYKAAPVIWAEYCREHTPTSALSLNAVSKILFGED